MNSHADVQYKPACPFCRGQGAANEVTMHNYQRTITYVCNTCKKTWTATPRPRIPRGSGAVPSS